MDISVPQKNILLIDDDINIRFVVKKLLSNILINAKIYSSEKGPEGLGLAYIIKPTIIILDTTLPKYSGRELIDFIATNNVFANTKIIVLHEDNDITSLQNLGYFTLSKNDKDFTTTLINIIKGHFEYKVGGNIINLGVELGKRVIRFANRSDRNVTKIETDRNILKITYYTLAFFINQLFTSFFLTLFIIILGRKDIQEELSEDRDEFSTYRSQVYSTFIITITAIVLTIIALILVILS